MAPKYNGEVREIHPTLQVIVRSRYKAMLIVGLAVSGRQCHSLVMFLNVAQLQTLRLGNIVVSRIGKYQ